MIKIRRRNEDCNITFAMEEMKLSMIENMLIYNKN